MSDVAELTGLGHIIVTPFTTDEQIDVASLRRAVDFAVGASSAAIVALGIMGEVSKLSDAERDLVVRTVVDQVAGRVPVIVGCTAEATLLAAVRAQVAADAGANAVMVAAPRAAATAPLQLAHFEGVASRSPVPVLLQDEPVSTGVLMSAATIGQILADSQVFGVKEEHAPTPTKVSAVLAVAPDARVFGGHGGQFLIEELDRGAVGTMTGFAVPSVLASICAQYHRGERDAARRTFFEQLPLIRYEAQLGPGGVTIRKQLLAAQGVIVSPTVRGPAPTVDPLALTELRALAGLE